MVQRMQLLASSIVPTLGWYYDEILFPICVLILTNYWASALPLAQEIRLV